VAEQLEFGVLPVAAFVAVDVVEAWLSEVMAAAEEVEARWGPWWGTGQIANGSDRPFARVGPALRCLERRRALEREQLGVGPRDEPVYRVRPY
jgi:hypothetical protein